MLSISMGCVLVRLQELALGMDGWVGGGLIRTILWSLGTVCYVQGIIFN